MGTIRILCFSGGIDSQACAIWLREAWPTERRVLLFSDTGNENPLTLDFLAHYTQKVEKIEIVTPIVSDLGNADLAQRRRLGFADEKPLGMLELAQLKGRFPSPTRRFCTQYLKLQPIRRWIAENIHDDYEIYLGVRAEESAARAAQSEREWSPDHDAWVNRPIHKWTKKQCFEIVRFHAEPINPLYAMGFSRVGCCPCIMLSKDQVRTWAHQCPKEVEKLRGWEAATGRYFFGQMLPGKRMGSVDEIITWSRTRHGGKLADLPLLEQELDRGGCTSIYGLCE